MDETDVPRFIRDRQALDDGAPRIPRRLTAVGWAWIVYLAFVLGGCVAFVFTTWR